MPFRNEFLLTIVWVAISGSYTLPNLSLIHI